MAATVFGTLTDILAHLLGGNAKYATPVVAGVEGPDGVVRAQQGNAAGAALVEVSGAALPVGAATLFPALPAKAVQPT